MQLNDEQAMFLQRNRGAAMTTLRRDGAPHTVRVGVTLVDGKIWSSGTQTRLRTKHLRRDPRATLYVTDEGFGYMCIESDVRIIEGAEVPELSARLFRAMQANMPMPQPPEGKLLWYGQEKTREEFLQIMREEQRLIYEFEPVRIYGLYGAALSR